MSPLVPLILSFLPAMATPASEPPRTQTAQVKTVEGRSQSEEARAVAPESNSDTPRPQADASSRPCHWWQKIGGCNQRDADSHKVEGLPPEAPRNGTVVTVDTSSNTIYLFRDGELISKGPAATGSEKYLRKGLKEWLFHTPTGRMKVLRKITDPVWTKPDWAFLEEGKAVPPPDSPKRKIKGHLGKYALDLGDGIMIHGTDDPDSLGKKVSHGCIRVGAELLEQIYSTASVGTEVYVF